jgi:hypothetical protein
MISSCIDLVTFRFAAQCLNQLCYRVPIRKITIHATNSKKLEHVFNNFVLSVGRASTQRPGLYDIYEYHDMLSVITKLHATVISD